MHRSFSFALGAAATLGLGVLSAPSLATTVVIDDNFDDGNLATNTTGVGSGFQRVNNGPGGGAGGAVGEAGTVGTATAAGSNANVGVVSIDTFDPQSPEAANGFEVTWVIDAVNITGTFNRIELVLQQSAGFRPVPYWELILTNGNNWEVEIRDSGFDVVDTVTGNFGNGLADGFSVTATFDEDGYTVTSTGLDSDIAVASTPWPAAPVDFDYDSFTASTRVAATIQNFGAGPSDTLSVDQITVTLIPEPGSLGLLGLGGMLIACRRRKTA